VCLYTKKAPVLLQGAFLSFYFYREESLIAEDELEDIIEELLDVDEDIMEDMLLMLRYIFPLLRPMIHAVRSFARLPMQEAGTMSLFIMAFILVTV
jgi:hypothetical protein